jgi:sorting nexin-29
LYQLFIDFRKAYDSVRREELYNNLNEFGIVRKRGVIIKMSLNESFSAVRIGKYQLEKFPLQNGLEKVDALSPIYFNFGLEYAIRRVQKNQEGLKIELETPAFGLS